MTKARLYRSQLTEPGAVPADPPPIIPDPPAVEDLSLTAFASGTRVTVTFNGEALNAPAGSFLNLGYGNMYGGYTLADKGWGSRADDAAYAVRDMSVTLFAALELHEENDMHLDFLARMRTLVDPAWSLAEGDGGNHLLYLPEFWTVLSAKSMMMPGNRAMSDFTVRDVGSGVVSHVLVAHFRADDTNNTSRASERAQEAAYLAQYAAPLTNAVICADLNSSSTAAGFPRAILAAGGWKSLRDTSSTAVENGNLGTYTGAVGGPWIEDILTRPEAEVTLGKLVPTNGVSDHYAWLSAQVAFSQVVQSGTRFSLYRTEQGRVPVPVPGWQNIPARTSVMTDNTVPLNREVGYVVRLTTGDEYEADPVTVVAPLPLLTHPVTGDVAECWIETWPELTYATTTTLVQVPGRRSPVVITSGEQLPTSEPQLLTRTAKQADDLEDLVERGEVLLLRTTDPRMPDAFIAITARSTSRILEFKLGSLTRRHTLSVQEIAPEDMNERAVGNTLGNVAAAIPSGTLGELAARFPGGTLLDIAATDWKALA